MKANATFKDLITALLDGATEGDSATGTLHIRGEKLIHYNTTIAERCEGKILLNYSRYSLQTGQLQKQIKAIVPEDKIILVRRVPIEYNGSLVAFLEDSKH